MTCLYSLRRRLAAGLCMAHFFRTAVPALALLGLLGARPALGQAGPPARIDQQLMRHNQRVPTEKLFLHLDRPSYLSGESMWFKVYAVDGTLHRPLAASKVAYVEVLNSEQSPVLQGKIGLLNATGQGSFVLPTTLASGRYTVRAYTNWMKNAGPELYFRTTVTVVNTRTRLGQPASPQALAYDVQLFPEGGSLVQDLPSRIGFKATDAAGRGVAAEGTVLDQAGVAVAQFKTLRFGMGSFPFTPTKAGGSYSVIVKIANQKPLTYRLPTVQPQGYVLRLEDAGPDQLRLVAQATGTAPDEQLLLLGHTRQQVNAALEGQLRDGQVAFTIAKSRLADGISHFTLFNSRRQPVCERLYFRPAAQQLALTAQPDKNQYGQREKVTLQLAATAAGETLPANVSVAAYLLDSLSTASGADILSSLWLTSDLKGTVENPGYYVSGTGPEVAAAADNLMLTQGWSRFRWDDVLANKQDSLVYAPEVNGHLIRGRVVNSATGQPKSYIPIYLNTPSRTPHLYTSISKSDGSVLFDVANLYGPRQLLVQPNLKRDSVYRVEILNPFTAPLGGQRPVPFALPERWTAALQRRHLESEVQQRYWTRPVITTLPKADTLAFFGLPSERYYLDQYTRFKVLEEVMREYVPGVLVRIRKDGFHFLVLDDNARGVSEEPLVMLDGMPVFDINQIMAIDPLKIQRLDVVTARVAQGQMVHKGIVSFSTYKGDLAGYPLDPHVLLQEYEGLQGQREFYAPRYDTPSATQSRLPDFRNLLYWNPTLTPGSDPNPTFYTGDQAGKYLVVIQGLSPDGRAGSASFTFEVKPAL